MAIALFSPKQPWIGPVRLDASITEEHEIAFRITSEPIETATEYTDGIIELPRPLEIVGVISTHTDTLIPTFSNTRHIEGWRRLVELAKLRFPFLIITSLARYPNMVVESLATTRSKQNTNRLVIRAQCRQLQLALVDDVSNLADPAVDIASTPAEIGDQGLSEVL